MVNMCSTGETLLYSEVVIIVRDILENGHYVMLVTNGTLTKRFEQFANFPVNLRKHLFFKLSFHYLELKRLNLLDTFFANIRLMQRANISFTVEITPDDSYIPYIDEIKKVCMKELGALCHVTVPRDETKKGYPLMTSLSRSEFTNLWKSFESPLFDFKESIFEVKRKEFCYAGQWGLVINLENGIYKQCYKGKTLGNIYDLDKPINYVAIGHHCREGHCFNGHAFLGFGLIPELNSPTFDKMRNRVLADNSEWLSSEMKAFMQCKLQDANCKLSKQEKCIADIKSISPKLFVKNILGRR